MQVVYAVSDGVANSAIVAGSTTMSANKIAWEEECFVFVGCVKVVTSISYPKTSSDAVNILQTCSRTHALSYTSVMGTTLLACAFISLVLYKEETCAAG